MKFKLEENLFKAFVISFAVVSLIFGFLNLQVQIPVHGADGDLTPTPTCPVGQRFPGTQEGAQCMGSCPTSVHSCIAKWVASSTEGEWEVECRCGVACYMTGEEVTQASQCEGRICSGADDICRATIYQSSQGTHGYCDCVQNCGALSPTMCGDDRDTCSGRGYCVPYLYYGNTPHPQGLQQC